MVNAKCVICKVADAVIRKTGPERCQACLSFFKRYRHLPLNELRQAKDCMGSCSDLRRCKQCRMKRCLAILSNESNIQSQKTENVLPSLERTPTKEKTQSAQKEQLSNGKKSKLSLKSSRQLHYSGEMPGALDKWATIKTEDTKNIIKSPEKMEKKVENQESDVKVPCVASLHNLGNTCFLNSVLQVLRYTPQFEEKLRELAREIKSSKRERELIAQLEQEDSADDPDKDIATWDVVTNLSEVFVKMKQAEENVMNGSCFIGTRPYDLIDIIGHLNPVFEGDQQQDAHELLRCLLAYIQDASRSLNRYRRKAAESLGRCIGKCAVEEKSVLASPKEVDLYGGSKSSPVQKSDKNNAKHSTSGTKQMSAGGTKDENSDVCRVKKLQTSTCVRNNHEYKLLTELQNHKLTGPKSVMNCCDVKNDKNRMGCENVYAGENVVAGCQKFSKPNKRPIAKRKLCHCCEKKDKCGKSNKCVVTVTTKGCTAVAQKKRRFSSGDKGVKQIPTVAEDKRAECEVTDVLDTLTPCSDTLLSADTNKNCSINGKPQDQKHIDKKCLSEKHERGSPRKSTCSGMSKKISDLNSVKTNPVMKELFVRLDKNGIDRYFKKQLSKPQSLAAIDRHISPVADCVEELFQGCVELWTRCCECEKVTTRREDYQDISVAIELKQPEEEEEEEQVEEKKTDIPLLENSEEPLKCKDVLNVIAQDMETAEKVDNDFHLDKDVSLSAGFVKVLRSSVGKGSAKVEDFSWIKKSLEEVEHLRDDSKYWCDSCCHLTEAERSMHYTSVPRVLTLHLKRFAVLNGSHRMFTKLTHHMPLPMLLPCIEDDCLTPEEHRLLLYGVIMHTGSTLSGGHYTAYVRAPVGSPGLSHRSLPTTGPHKTESVTSSILDISDNCDGTMTTEAHDYTDVWFACDDDVIKILPEKEFVSLLNQGSKYTMSPYLLFYHRL